VRLHEFDTDITFLIDKKMKLLTEYNKIFKVISIYSKEIINHSILSWKPER
jgi:hypothetical protein